METGLSGKTVLVTGAGGGLGSAICRGFAAEGALLTAADAADAKLDHLPPHERISFDLRDQAGTVAAAEQLVSAGRVPDILINNAGWTRLETMGPLTPEKAIDEINLNLTAVVAFTAPLAKAMAARKHGSIVFISSVNAISHYGNPAYAAAKAGINAYAKALAVEWGKHGVRANVVCPGSIRTPAWDHRIARDPSIPHKLAAVYPLARIVNADEVARAVVFLASELASGITGAILPVDAGLTAGNKPFIDSILGET